jgi:hypothetical protein
VLWAREAHDPKAPSLSVQGNIDPDNREIDFRRYYDRRGRKPNTSTCGRSRGCAHAEEDIPAVGDRVPLQVGPLVFHRSIGPGRVQGVLQQPSAPRHDALLEDRVGVVDTLSISRLGMAQRRPPEEDPRSLGFRGVSWRMERCHRSSFGRWGGFIFINADRDAVPLESARWA